LSNGSTNETGTDGVTVVFVCEWCGGRVELVPSSAGIEISDARAFLDAHAECLRRGATLDLTTRR
jgi:hypothetical protein